jgi:hypothetical protein
MGGFAGGVAGASSSNPGIRAFTAKLGGAIGKKIDKHVIGKYRCQSCGKSIWK